MKMQFSKNEVTNAAVRAAIIAAINDSKHGGFMSVIGFESKDHHGEKADYTYCKGIDYPAAVAKSLAMLDAQELDARNNPAFSISATRGVWNNAAGESSPTGRKSKEYNVAGHVKATYKGDSSVLLLAFARARASLVAPLPPTKVYTQLGNGVYKDENGIVYLRDLRRVSKRVTVKGDWPHSCSGELVALAYAIKKDMPVSHYRIFRLDADYDSITLGGIELEQLMPNIETTQEKEAVAAAPVAAPVAV